MGDDGFRRLRVYRHHCDVSSLLMASYIRVQNHLDTSHADAKEIKDIQYWSTRCYNKQMRRALASVKLIETYWKNKDVENVSKECKRLTSINLRGATLSTLFESPIVSGRKNSNYYSELEEKHEDEIITCPMCKGQKKDRPCFECKDEFKIPWKFQPCNYPPVELENLSHNMNSFKQDLWKFYESLK